jgi:hypothetical protein
MSLIQLNEVLLASRRLRPGDVAGELGPKHLIAHRAHVEFHTTAVHAPILLPEEEQGVRYEASGPLSDRDPERGVFD